MREEALETKKMLDFVNPNIELTAAVKPNLYQARERFFQEWDVWIAAGYIDKVLIMNYSKDLKGFASIFMLSGWIRCIRSSSFKFY